MKFAAVGVVLLVAGFFLFQKYKPKEAPPPAPMEALAPPPPPAPLISPEEEAKIVKSASDDNPEVRWEALKLLDKMKAPSALPLLLEKFQKDPEIPLRVRIAEMLGARKSPDVSRVMVAGTKDFIPEIRVAALKALEAQKDVTTASAVTDCLKDPEEAVKLQALKTLNALQETRAAEIAEENRRQEEIRRQAEEAAKQGQ